jgi:Rrf2 family protein
MRVTAKVDYAVRAATELAAHAGGGPVKASSIAAAQDVPVKFLETILQALRHAGLVASTRGQHGGHTLARAPETISVADVIRAVDGPIAAVAGLAPEDLPEGARRATWIAVRAALRDVLEHVTLADLAAERVPEHVRSLTADPDAWVRR